MGEKRFGQQRLTASAKDLEGLNTAAVTTDAYRDRPRQALAIAFSIIGSDFVFALQLPRWTRL